MKPMAILISCSWSIALDRYDRSFSCFVSHCQWAIATNKTLINQRIVVLHSALTSQDSIAKDFANWLKLYLDIHLSESRANEDFVLLNSTTSLSILEVHLPQWPPLTNTGYQLPDRWAIWCGQATPRNERLADCRLVFSCLRAWVHLPLHL